jgi:tetratricopeptide (TPR) repeat protein
MTLSGPPAPSDLPPQRPWLTWILGALFLLGLAYWLAGPSTIHFVRSQVAIYYAGRTQERLQQKDWNAAAKELARARSWQVNQPQVLRAYADLLIATRTDSLSLLQVLRLLEFTPHAAPKDQLRISQILISLGHIADARIQYDQLPEGVKQTQESRELLAALYHAEGRHEEADKVMRHALAMTPNDPQSRLRLAILDHRDSFPEIQRRIEAEIGEIATLPDDVGLSAIEFLTSHARLDGQQADKLLDLIEKHPNAPASARYAALSARLRARPQDRETVLKTEIQKVQGKGIESLAPAAAWLLQEKQPQEVLLLLPEDLCLKSAPFYQSRLLALSQLDRWGDIEKALATTNRLPISVHLYHLWKARTAEKLDNDIRAMRHHLKAAFAETLGGQDRAAATLTAEVAEQMNLWDLALLFYNDIATEHPMARGLMLEKAYAMAQRGRDTDAALIAATSLAALHPENLIFSQRIIYLKLVAGQEIELWVRTVEELPPSPDAMSRLLRALGAYRLGDLISVRSHLQTLPKQTDLPAGRRAVYSGLLAACGQTGPAFQMAESIPAALLFPEELVFLNKAR